MKDNQGNTVRPSKRVRTCPRCHKKHRWPTEDKLCRKCEEEWCESDEYKVRLAIIAA